MAFNSNIWTVLMILSLLAMAAARPQEFDDEGENYEQADERKEDPARVQIKVYRGPTKNDGYAPWGFWVKQPSDEQ